MADLKHCSNISAELMEFTSDDAPDANLFFRFILHRANNAVRWTALEAGEHGAPVLVHATPEEIEQLDKLYEVLRTRLN